MLIALSCSALVAFSGAAYAQQAADDDEDTFEQKIIKNILGGLGVDVGRGGIDYRERSPLVIPPSRELPPPQASGATANPAWPREQQQKKVAIQNRSHSRATPDEPGTSSIMTPDELRRGINPRAQRITDPSKSGSMEEPDIGRPMRPDELNPGQKSIFSMDGLWGGRRDGERATFTGEPARSSLTQPPPGYQTPSASQPYGMGEDKSSGWKIPTILDRPVGQEN